MKSIGLTKSIFCQCLITKIGGLCCESLAGTCWHLGNFSNSGDFHADERKCGESSQAETDALFGGLPIGVSDGKISDSGKQTLLHIQRIIAFIEDSGDRVHQATFDFKILTEKK